MAKEIVQEFHPCQPLNSLIEGVRRADVGGVHRNALNVNKINLPPANSANPSNPSQVEKGKKGGYSVNLIVTSTKTSQELRMLSSVTLNCQVTMMIVMNSGSQLSEMSTMSHKLTSQVMSTSIF